MEVERQGDGRWHFALGVVERWIVGLCATALVGMCYAGWSSIVAKQDKQAELTAALAQQQAVTNAQMVTLQAQLADVPGLTSSIAELRVQASRNAEDIAEIRAMRGLK